MTEHEQDDADFTEPLEAPVPVEDSPTEDVGQAELIDDEEDDLDATDITVVLPAPQGSEVDGGDVVGVDVTEDMGSIGQMVDSLPGGEEGVDATEEMFVVLPDDDDIPVIETEEVTGSDLTVEEFDPDAEPTEMDMGLDGGGGPDELDELIYELDDDMVTDEVGLEDGDEAAGADPDFGNAGGGGFAKVLIPAAALLLIGLAVYMFFPSQPSSTDAAGSGTTPVSVSGGTQGPTSVVSPPQPQDDPVDHQSEVERIVTARRTFSEKFELALELGFEGHSGND